jgi:hypothetical protein
MTFKLKIQLKLQRAATVGKHIGVNLWCVSRKRLEPVAKVLIKQWRTIKHVVHAK